VSWSQLLVLSPQMRTSLFVCFARVAAQVLVPSQFTVASNRFPVMVCHADSQRHRPWGVFWGSWERF